MQERIQKAFNDLLGKWNNLENKQKIQIGAVFAVVLVSLGITIFLATRPDWVYLIENRSQSEIQQIQTAMNDLGYKTRPAQNGTALEIERKNLEQASIDLSGQDINLDGDFTFANALDAGGMASTETVRKEAMIKAKASELSRELTKFEGVTKATVILGIPEKNTYFIQNSEKPTASVNLTTSELLDSKRGRIIAKYVASSVVGLTIDNVEVYDQNFNALWSGTDNLDGGFASQDEIVIKRKNEVENRIRQVFAPLYDEVKISSSLVFNWDKDKLTTTVITPPIEDSETGVPFTSALENQSVVNGEQGNAEGLEVNNNQTPQYNIGEGTQSTIDVKNSTIEYKYNEKVEITEKSQGDLIPEDSTMAITVYKYKEYKEDVMEELGQLNGTTWEEFKQNQGAEKLTIDDDLIEAAKSGTGIEKIIFIGYELPIFTDRVEEPTDIRTALVFGALAILIALLGYGLLKTSAQSDEVTEIEPELSVEDLLVSTQLEEQKEVEINKQYEEIDYGKEPENKKQIEKFVDEKPEAVAQLLRNWLNEEWE